VYSSAESGLLEIYVRPLGREGSPRQISTESALPRAVWSRDGKQIYFVAANTMMASDITVGPQGFSSATPPRLFDLTGVTVGSGGRGCDYAPLTIPRMGFIVPSMGTKRTRLKPGRKPASAGLADALFSKVQQRVLAVLFGNPGRSYYANEIIGLAHSGTGAVQRELARLESSGLVTVTRLGRQKHFQANSSSPLFEELRTLALKTFGLADVLRTALEPVAKGIRAAFVYGSIAKGRDTVASDIDVLVISDALAYAELFAALEGASVRLGRKIAPTIYSSKELAERVKRKNAFVTRVLAQPKVWLIGDEQVLTA
jgi:predicted nucleotidyltransferase